MGRRSGRPLRARAPLDCTSELETFLSPETVFSDPFEVVAHPGLSVGEKRAILARWLAQVCASEAALGLKWMPGESCEAVQFDDVMDALEALEKDPLARRTRRHSEAARISASRKLPKSVGTVH